MVKNPNFYYKEEFFPLNSPLLLGSLWDITDKDTDIMTEKLLKILKNTRNSIEIVEALTMARKFFIFIEFIVYFLSRSCRLKYLNGGAFVCYGIPVNFS